MIGRQVTDGLKAVPFKAQIVGQAKVTMIGQKTENLQMEAAQPKDGFRARSAVWLHLFVGAWAFAASYVYAIQVIVPGNRNAYAIFDEIVSRSAASPYAYRLLVPYLIKWMIAPLSWLKPQTAFCVGYVVFAFLAIEFSTFVLFRMFRLWFDTLFSLIGAMMFCLMVMVAAHHDLFQPWSLLEPGLYAAAIMLGMRRRVGWALLLTVIATLNRETGLFVPLLFGAAWPGRWLEGKRVLWGGILGAAWLAIFVGLHLSIGMSADRFTVDYVWDENLNFLGLTSAATAAFLLIALPGVLSRHRVPAEIRRCAWTLLLYVPLVVLFGLWWEVRHWLPIACILLPCAIAGLQSLFSMPAERSEGAAGGHRV